MQSVRRMLQEHYFTIMMLSLAGGFAMLLAELLMLAHTDGLQLVGVIACVIGLILTLAALFVQGRAATTIAVLLLVLSATGLFGAYEHFENRNGEEAKIQRQVQAGNQLVAYVQDDEAEAQNADDNEGPPPPLAPLSLAGLSVVAAVTMLGAPRKE